MTEVKHLRCDLCGTQTTVDSNQLRAERDWAYCAVGLDHFDFCPACWNAMRKTTAPKGI